MNAELAQPLGHVLSVKGSQATVGLLMGLPSTNSNGQGGASATVGRFLGIRRGEALLVGIVSEVSMEVSPLVREVGYHAAANVDLMGEVKGAPAGPARFNRGVTEYPALGDPATLMSGDKLRLVYELRASNSIEVGLLQQDTTIVASVNVDEMLHKHFAVLGSTGVGKSSGVALLLQQILRVRPDLRIFLLDAHNEYAHCFGDSALVLNPSNLKLPFWLFNLDEMIGVIFGGRAASNEEIEILAELIPLAKELYLQNASRLIVRRTDSRSSGFTNDTPVPYRLQDLIFLIDQRMGKLENRSSRMNYFRLITRLEIVSNDPRYAFMFDSANVGGDTMADTLRHLFRWEPNGKPMTIMQLAGFPADVVDAVVSMLGRLAFDFGVWSYGATQLLFVCEEAHRYVSADRSLGFAPTRRAVSRIAKEGGKHGLFLGLVTQRPAELDPTIVSQCSTLFAMRMANDRDQAIIRTAASDAAANLLRLLPSLGSREVIAFGAGVALPTRFMFPQLPEHRIPRIDVVSSGGRLDAGLNEELVESAIDRWRAASSGKQKMQDTRAFPGGNLATAEIKHQV